MTKVTDKYYLKEEVYFEPLVNHWYAWPYLIPPATASRFISKSHRRIMTSFVQNYQLHQMAKKETALVGGEFLDGGAEQVKQIKALLPEMETRCGDLLKLSEALDTLEEMLRSHSSGISIEQLYRDVPEILRGMVELHMDSEHRAGYRLIEPLLYESGLYKTELQSVLLGRLSAVDERPFVFSNPRLADAKHVELALDFNHPLLKTFLASRTEGITREQLDNISADVTANGGIEIDSLFQMGSPMRKTAPVEEGVRLQYTGHAGFLIETPDFSMMVDPVIAPKHSDQQEAQFSYGDLPEKIDYVCLTHNHQDHVNIETLLQIRHLVGTVLVPKNNGGSLFDPSVKLLLSQLEFNVVEMDDLESMALPGGKLTAIPFLGEHGDLNIRSKTAWHVEVSDKKMFFGADSANPDMTLYERLQPYLADLDVFAIGMECVGAPYTWLYGALHTKAPTKQVRESRRLNGSDFDQAEPIIDLLKPRQVYIYALGKEPWYKYFMGIEYQEDSAQVTEYSKLIAFCQSHGIYSEALYGHRTVILA